MNPRNVSADYGVALESFMKSVMSAAAKKTTGEGRTLVSLEDMMDAIGQQGERVDKFDGFAYKTMPLE